MYIRTKNSCHESIVQYDIIDMLTALNAKQSTLVTVESGNICTSLDNKQRLVATTDAKLKVQRYDDDVSIITDSWVDELSLDWNTNTNKATLNVPAELAVTGNLTVTGNHRTHLCCNADSPQLEG